MKTEKFINLFCEPEKIEKIISSLMGQQFTILSKKQEIFLNLIKGKKVIIQTTKKAKKDKDFQELTNLLSKMHKDGLISGLQIVEK